MHLSTSLDQWICTFFPPKVSWAVGHQLVRVSVRVRVGMDYTHQTVNHLTNFIELGCGAHIQIIVSFWHLYKMQDKCLCGIHHGMVDSYLCEFKWRQKYKENYLFMQILNDMNEFHSLQSLIKRFLLKPWFCMIFRWLLFFFCCFFCFVFLVGVFYKRSISFI